MTAIYFATINGAPVRLERVSYAPSDPRYQHATAATPNDTGRTVRNGIARAIGYAPDGRLVEADRLIYRPTAPSNHKCGPRCRAAKGRDCQCSCGGLHHGAG